MNNQQQFPYQPQSDDNQGNDGAAPQSGDDNTQYPIQYMNTPQQPENDQDTQDTAEEQVQQATNGAQNFDNFWHNDQQEAGMRQPQNSQQSIADNQEAPEPAPQEQENLQQPSIQEEHAPGQEPPAQTQPDTYAPQQQPAVEPPQQFAQNPQPPQPQQPEAPQQPQPEMPQQSMQDDPDPQEPAHQGQENMQQDFQEAQEGPAQSEPSPQLQPYADAPQQPDPGAQQQQPNEMQQTEEELLQALKSNQQQGPPQIQNFNRRGTTRPIEDGEEQQPGQQQEVSDERSSTEPANMQAEEDIQNPEDAFKSYERPATMENTQNDVATDAGATTEEENVVPGQQQTAGTYAPQPQEEVQPQTPQPVSNDQFTAEPQQEQQAGSTFDQVQESQPADQQFPSQQADSAPDQTEQPVEPSGYENQQTEPESQFPPQQQTQAQQQPETPIHNQPEQPEPVQQPAQTDTQQINDPQQLVSGEGFAEFDKTQTANEQQPQAAPPQDEVTTSPATEANKEAASAFNFASQQISPNAESSSQVTRMDQPVAATETQQQVKSFKTKAQDVASKVKKVNYKPLITAAIFGIVIFTIFNSQVILGQVQYFTTPSGSVETPVGATDVDAPVGDEDRILIPQIDVNVPVVYDEPSFEEEKVQKALERGVVHYGNTAMPGEKGNSVIVGHSSNNWWDSGKYKFAFILLDKLDEGDEIVLHFEGTRYVYEVTDKKVVVPTNTSVLDQSGDPKITLITCTPPGTSWKRLIIEAEQVSPDPDENEEVESSAQETNKLPDDSGTGGFFESIGEWF